MQIWENSPFFCCLLIEMAGFQKPQLMEYHQDLPTKQIYDKFQCWFLFFQVTDISLLALNRIKDKNLPLPHPPLHLPRPRLNQRALVFTLNLNELPLPALWAVCISATGEPMRSGLTCYNNLFHLASHITHETIQSSISVWTFLSPTDPQAQPIMMTSSSI